jgi:glycosyltransferase involved in cell wall biosynthesis
LDNRLLFDVSGLIQWYAYFKYPTGIQRVTEKLLGSSPIRNYSNLEFVARVLGSDTFYRVDQEPLFQLNDSRYRSAAIARLRAIFAQSMRLATLSSLRRDLRYFHLHYLALGSVKLEAAIEAWSNLSLPARLPPLEVIVAPTEADAFFNPGDYWCHDTYVDALVTLKRKTNVQIVQLIHDLFAIDRPDWTNPRFSRAIINQFHRLAPNVDQWLTTSHFVMSTLCDYLARHSVEKHRTSVLPMGWDDLGQSTSNETASDQNTLRRHGLWGKRYVLHVGTIEPRKNLLSLLDALAKLRRIAALDVPYCVLVGREGWRSSVFRQRLRSTGFEGGTTIWLKDVPDDELPAIYRGALFTVVPSSAEGWGLPVRESLAHGVPCLASRTGGLQEAGGALASYFSPNEPDSLPTAIARWLSESRALDVERSRIADYLSNSHRPTWNDTGTSVLNAIFGNGVSGGWQSD